MDRTDIIFCTLIIILIAIITIGWHNQPSNSCPNIPQFKSPVFTDI